MILHMHVIEWDEFGKLFSPTKVITKKLGIESN
jgi:hypothetical protein